MIHSLSGHLRKIPVTLFVAALSACITEEKPALTPPTLMDDSSADGFLDDTSVVGSLDCGASVEGVFRGETFLAYELEVQRGSSLSLSLEAPEDDADPVLYLYGPSATTAGDLELLAENDDATVASPDARLDDIAVEQSGPHLVVIRDYHGRTGLRYSLTVACSVAENIEIEDLQETVERLGRRCRALSFGTDCGIAVENLLTGERASWNGDMPVVSASSPKFLWTAAALHYGVSRDIVEPHAIPLFEHSDNYATAAIIDLVPSPSSINDFMFDEIGMRGSCFRAWSYSGIHDVGGCPASMDDVLEGDNVITADDAVLFLSRLYRGELLDEANTAAILEWSTLSPRSGFGGWIPAGLPEPLRAAVHHKDGAIPPEVIDGYSISHDIGIVELPEAGAYSVAILMTGGRSYYARQVPLIPYIACVLHEAITEPERSPFSADRCLPPAAFIGTPCVVDEDCDGLDQGRCTANESGQGFCSIACDGYCPDREGFATTFCVDGRLIEDSESGGLCVSRAAWENTRCSDIPGTEVEGAARFGDPEVLRDVCLPVEL